MSLSLTHRPASSSNDGASYVSSSTNLTTSGLLRRLSSTSGSRMMSGGRVARRLLCRLSDWSRPRLVRLRGRDDSWLSLTTNETRELTRPSSVGRLDRWLPPRYKISSLWQTDRNKLGLWLGLGLPTPEGWKAELTLVVGYILRWFTCPQTVTHPSSNHLIATWLGVECRTNSKIEL